MRCRSRRRSSFLASIDVTPTFNRRGVFVSLTLAAPDALDAIENLVGNRGLRHDRERLSRAIRIDEGDLVRIAAETSARFERIVGDDEVESLVGKLPLG